MFACPNCGIPPFLTLKRLLRHIRLSHSDQECFIIQCSFQGCWRTFRNLRTFENHIYSHHNISALNVIEIEEADTDDVNNTENEGCPEIASYDNEINDGNSPTLKDDMQIQRAAATWILKTRESHRIPLSVMDSMIQDVQSLFDIIVSNLNSEVQSCLQNSGVSQGIVESVGSMFGNCQRVFAGLQTQQQQLSFFRRNFNFVDPIKILLGTKKKPHGLGSKRRLVEKEEVFVYIPILQTLQALLNNEIVLSEVERGHQQNSVEVLSDFCDGSHFRSHPMFATHSKSLQIFLYYDDIEMCNPLGSHTKKHKLGVFYFLLGNLHPKYRSKLKSIQLVALCKNRYIKKYSLNAILTPIIQDLKKLELGHTFTVHGSPRHYHGTLALVSADNPASSAMGGFKESSSAHRHCRQCMGTKEEMKIEFDEDFYTLRTLESHLHHCTQIEDDHTGNLSREYGVNNRSTLLDLENFDMCCGTLLPDVMHDLLEGVTQHLLQLLFTYCIDEKKYFTLSALNEKISGIELGYMEDNRPATIDNYKHLRQNASQTWTLSRLLTIMVGCYVSEDDIYWSHYTDLLEISCYLLAPTIHQDEIALVKVKIANFLSEFVELYPDASVIPKMHYMVHIPRLMMKFGPLVRHWTMRYEAKHNYLKKMGQSIGNYINIAWTLAMRHQYLLCYYSISGEGLLEISDEIGPGDTVASRDLPDELKNESHCYRPNWVKVDGIAYQKPCALLIGVEDDYPLFGRLDSIYIVDNRFLFSVTLLNTILFNRHFQGYVIDSTTDTMILPHKQLHSPFPLHIHYISSLSLKIIICKHHIYGTLL